jgi:hypothetical protein
MHHVSVYPYPHAHITASFAPLEIGRLSRRNTRLTPGTADTDTPAYLLYDKPHPLFYLGGGAAESDPVFGRKRGREMEVPGDHEKTNRERRG